MSASTLFISPEHIVYEGALGQLKQHSHAVIALLIGLERTFSLATDQGEKLVRVALIPAAVRHRLDFYDARTLVVYFEPHDPSYAALHHFAGGRCPSLDELPADVEVGVRAWTSSQAPIALIAAIRTHMGPKDVHLDERIARLCGALNQGKLLDADVDEMSRSVALSSSRLLHLFKSELGVGIRRLKQHYRFKIAASAVARGETLTQAAHSAGFSDSAHLSRAFSETFGLNPTKVFSGAVRFVIAPH